MPFYPVLFYSDLDYFSLFSFILFHSTLSYSIFLYFILFYSIHRFGFNAGSAYGANQSACYALLATQIATSVSALMWMFTEWGVRKRPSILGMVNGAIAGQKI